MNSTTVSTNLSMPNANLQNTAPAKIQEEKINNNAVDNKTTKNGDTITIAGKEINKKTAIIGGIITLGAIAGTAALIIKGKAKNKPKEQSVETIRQFFDKNNNLVENVELKKGKAINADGSNFSGFFKTKNKNNDEVTIEYAEGIIKKATVEGKFEKIYKNKGGELTEVVIKKGGKTKKANLENIKDAVCSAQGDYKRYMNSSVSLGPLELKYLEAYDGKYLTKAQKDDMSKMIKKLDGVKKQFNKDIKDATKLAYSKEMEFRDKFATAQQTYKDAIARFNNGEGTAGKDGAKIIKDYSKDGKLSKEIILKGKSLTVRDFDNKTLLEGSYNNVDDFYKIKRYYEGYEKTGNTIKYDKMYQNNAATVYDSFNPDENGLLLPVLGKYQEGYSSTNGHTKIAKELSLTQDTDSTYSIALKDMKKLAKGEKTGKIFRVPAFSEGCEILPDGTRIFKKKGEGNNVRKTFDYYTNLKCADPKADLDNGTCDRFITTKIRSLSDGKGVFKQMRLDDVTKKYKTIKDWIK